MIVFNRNNIVKYKSLYEGYALSPRYYTKKPIYVVDGLSYFDKYGVIFKVVNKENIYDHHLTMKHSYNEVKFEFNNHYNKLVRIILG